MASVSIKVEKSIWKSEGYIGTVYVNGIFSHELNAPSSEEADKQARLSLRRLGNGRQRNRLVERRIIPAE